MVNRSGSKASSISTFNLFCPVGPKGVLLRERTGNVPANWIPACRNTRLRPSICPVFEIGKAIVLKEEPDVSIFATDHLVWQALEAGKLLAKQGIEAKIINIHTINPLDKEAILQSVRKTGWSITAEEAASTVAKAPAVIQRKNK